MGIITRLIIPIVILIIIFNGLKYGVNVYDSFLNGAKEGLGTVFNIFPAILAMVFAINIFLDSGIIIFITSKISSFIKYTEILPMAFLRPISGTATLAILNDILLKYGPDSMIGRLASILQGCTDTTIYVLALYFGSIHINKTKYALFVGLFADLVGIIAAFIITKIFFGI